MSIRIRTGRLACDVKGRFSTWKAGTRVKAEWFRGHYNITRERRIPSGIFREGLPIINGMVGVPRKSIIFDS